MLSFRVCRTNVLGPGSPLSLHFRCFVVPSLFALPPCEYNINRHGRDQRMRLGLGLFAFGMALGIVLVKAGLPVGARVVVFVPFLFGSLTVFQAAHRTCVVRAFRRERETGHGIERVANPEQCKVDRARAWRVFRTSALVATAATSALFLIP